MYQPTGILHALNPAATARNLWARRDLIRQFTSREIQARYRGTLLGLGWALLQPLIMLGVYSIVFGLIFPQAPPNSHHARAEVTVNLFCGLSVFNIFADCVARSTGIVLANPNFVKKVVFPLEILPLSILGATFLPAIFNFVLIFLGALYINDGSIPVSQLLIPVVMVPLIMFTLGTAWFLGALGVFFRDVGQVIGLVLQALSFLSAIFYTFSKVPPSLRTALYFNPIAVTVESLRIVVLGKGDLPVFAISMIAAFSFVFMMFGYAFFFKCKRAFADVI